jgi:hypothetical protein
MCSGTENIQQHNTNIWEVLCYLKWGCQVILFRVILNSYIFLRYMKFNNSKCMVSRICLIKLFDLNMSSVSVCSVSGFHKKEMGQVKVPCDVFTIIPVFLSFFFWSNRQEHCLFIKQEGTKRSRLYKERAFFYHSQSSIFILSIVLEHLRLSWSLDPGNCVLILSKAFQLTISFLIGQDSLF